MEIVVGASTPTSGSLGGYEQKPYRPARQGSGVLCPNPNPEAPTQKGPDQDLCESPLTTRLRGGVDTLGRPLGEYLCETCGAVFVAIIVGLDPVVKFSDVATQPEEMTEKAPINIATALRRGERAPRLSNQALKRKIARLEICTECENIVRTDNGEWEAHQRGHLED